MKNTNNIYKKMVVHNTFDTLFVDDTGSALVNDLCGGCVSKRGNIFYNVHDKS